MRGFTLLEIIVTITLLMILMTVLLPVLYTTQDTAQIAVCTGNLKQIHSAIVAESLHRTGRLSFPDISQWQSYMEAITEPQVLICPMDGGQHFKNPTNNVEFIEPPPTVKFNKLQSDDTIFVFREKENFLLTFDLEALTQPGEYGKKIGPFDSKNIIPTGTMVDVFYFHFDPKTKFNRGSTRMDFGPNKAVIGFIAQNDPGDQELNETDLTLGLESEGVVYEKHYARRLEGAGDPRADKVTIPDTREFISYDSSYASPKFSDTMRVITTPGAGTSYGMNREIHQNIRSHHQIFLTDATYPIIDFDDIDVHENSPWPGILDARHFGKVNTLFVDGSIELLPPEALKPENLLWRDGH